MKKPEPEIDGREEGYFTDLNNLVSSTPQNNAEEVPIISAEEDTNRPQEELYF